MKVAIALIASLFAAPLAAAPAGVSLPGVADEETRISSGVIREFHRGHGDVMFVRDRANRWFRVQLNDGCLRGPLPLNRVVFSNRHGGTAAIDRFTSVRLPETGRNCAIKSIRRSVAPPQVDADSPITLN